MSSDPIVLGDARYERFGIALHSAKQVLNSNPDKVHFHLYPKLANAVGGKSWVQSSTKQNDKQVNLTLYHSRSLKSHYGIRIEDTDCFKTLLNMFKSAKTYDIVKVINSTERVRLIGDIKFAP